MRYLYIKNNKVVNIVEYQDTPPAKTDLGEDIVLATTGFESVNDPFIVPVVATPPSSQAVLNLLVAKGLITPTDAISVVGK